MGGELPPDRVEKKCHQLENMTSAVLKLAKDGDIDDVLRGLIGSGVKLRHLERMRSTLEDLYLDVAGGGGA